MRALVAGLALAAAVVGCGTATTTDLMAIEVTGGPATADRRIRVTDDGRASCGAGELQAVPSQTVLDARGVKRSLRPLAKRGASFRAGVAGGRSYVFRSFDGVVRWTEGADGPPALGRAALFTLRLERLLCRRRG